MIRVQLTDATATWLIPSIATLAAVFLGGLLTLALNDVVARRARRQTLAERALEAVTQARLTVAEARMETANPHARPSVLDARSATEVQARFEMIANVERGEDRRAISAAGYNLHEWLLGGASALHELDELQAELSRVSWLLMAWERRAARGRDFKLPHAAVRDRFAPAITDTDLPRR